MDAPVPLGKYLGCNHIYGEAALQGGKLRPSVAGDRQRPTHRTIQYEMSEFLRSCVERYTELAGTKGANLKKALTPYIDEAPDEDKVAAPAGVTHRRPVNSAQ